MKILVVACYGPLINNSAAIESLTYLNGLVELNHEVDLLTVDFNEDSIYYDEKIFKLLNKKVKVHKIKGGFLFNKSIPKKNKSKEKKRGFKIFHLIKYLKNKIMIPDAYYIWSINAYRYYKKNLKEINFEKILSMHEPPSSHLAALRINKKSKLPWIAYFSDPWILDSSRESMGIFRSYIEKKLERKVIKFADKYIFVTESNKLDFESRYKIDKEKTIILTRSYDKKLYDEIKKEVNTNINEKKEKIVINYTGEIFSKLRDVKPFIKALEDIKDRDKFFFERLEVNFYGNIDSNEIIELIEKSKVINLHSRINFRDALKKIINSDILLLFGNKGSKQIPAKLYDYLGANSAILVILGDEKDSLKDSCEKINKCFIAKNNLLDIKETIYNIISHIDNGIVFNEEEEYCYLKTMEKLKKIID